MKIDESVVTNNLTVDDIRRPHRWRLVATMGLVLVGMAVAGASSAQASPSRFTYEVCDSQLPGGGVPVSEHEYSNAFSAFENCATPGGAIGLVETEPASATFGALWVSIPATPGGFVESDTLTAIESYVEPGNALHDSHIIENGFPGAAPESTRFFLLRTAPSLFGGSGGSFTIYMSCDGNVGPCTNGMEGARWIAATEVDPSPPTLTSPEGSLLVPGTIRGNQNLSVEAADVGGGITSIQVLVNGVAGAPPTQGACALGSVANKSYAGVVALSPTPCPPTLKAIWPIDTESYPFRNGANVVQVCASDFSTLGDPNTTCSPARTIEVDNSCNASPVAGGEQLSAQFSQSNAETQTVGFGEEAQVIGQLDNNAGQPVSGATLCVKIQTLGTESIPSDVGTVQTDASGNYSYSVPPGPNRQVLIGYRHDTAQIARNVRYYSHAKPILKAGPKKLKNDEKVRLWGSLPEPMAGGRVVVLQANVPGSHRWITFRKATTGERGRFKASYHFTSTTRKITYRFRALVPRQAGYPWDQGASESVPVVVAR